MPLVSMRQLLDHAAEHNYGIPAFNVNNLEQVQAAMDDVQGRADRLTERYARLIASRSAGGELRRPPPASTCAPPS